MNIDEAKQHVGKAVMSIDPGNKLWPHSPKPHGPYILLQVTKGGRAILSAGGNLSERSVRPSHITPLSE